MKKTLMFLSQGFEDLEMDSNIISCAGPASSLEVAYRLVEALTGRANAEEVKRLMVY